ncbi:MAG: mandelate racemase/muconate lactonizing enzyme family protein [Pseudomonadota bacterium]
MKIRCIATIRPKQPATLIFVEIETEDGFTGLGETWFGAETVEAEIHTRLAPHLLGQDATRIEHLTRIMMPYVGAWGSGAEMRALSAVEVALWDLAAKREAVPLMQLFGGSVRERIPVYNTCAGPAYVSSTSDVRPENFGTGVGADYEDLQAFMDRPVELAHSLLEMGIAAMKIWPFDFAEGAAKGDDISPADLRRALAPFEAVRAALGDKMALKAELHGLWSLPTALKICHALEDLDPDWVEDPVRMDRPDELAELVGQTRCPIAGGETLGGLGQISALIASKLSYPIVDVTWGGGISFARNAASMAEAAGRPIAFHDCSGPVALAVSTHLAMALPNVREQEITRAFYALVYPELVSGLPILENGKLSLTSEPGHGIKLLPSLQSGEDAVKRVSEQPA